MDAMTSHAIAIIPARGGSKGVPGKNIISIAGKPLIEWTIEACHKAKCISDIYVTSDDDEILNIASQCGASIIARPFCLAADNSSSDEVVFHALKQINKLSMDHKYAVLLQPTSPLRTEKHIDDAFKLLVDSDADTLISVNKTDNKILKSLIKDNDGVFSPISKSEYMFLNRQDLPEVYSTNGAMYFIEIQDFLKSKSFFGKKPCFFEMSLTDSIDIDSTADLQVAEIELMKRFNS